MTNALITQSGVEIATIGDAKARCSQSGAEVAVTAAGSKPRLSQSGVEVAVSAAGAKPRLAQSGFEVLASFLLAPTVGLVSLCSREIEVNASAESALSYDYYRADSEFGSYTLRHSGASATYVDTVPLAYHDYWYKVKATYVEGVGPLSFPLSAQAKDVPGKMTTPTVVPGDGEVTLTWSLPEHTTSFAVFRRLINSPLDSGELIASEIGELGYTDVTAENDMGYVYSVAAVNDCGPGLVSDEVSAIPHCCLGEWQVSPACESSYLASSPACESSYLASSPPSTPWTG